MSAELLRAARAYVKRRLSVVPVNPLGHENPKGPAISSWKQYQTRLPTDKELVQWYGNGSRSRLAIVGGSASRGLVFLDVDDLELAERVRGDEDFMEGMVVSSTPSGGLHLYFRVREWQRVGTRPYPNAEKPQGEIRSEGAYVVAPPSPGYKWEQSGVIPILDDWPTWFRGFCSRFGVEDKAVGGRAGGTRGTAKLSARMPDVIAEGRHNLLMREATRLHFKGLSEQDIYKALKKIDDERCKPPLGDKEIKRLSRWAGELPDKKQYELTDVGNSQRLVERYGENLRYSPGRGWFVWTGKRWMHDALWSVYELAKETALAIEDESDSDAVLKWSRVSQSGQRLREMVNLARSDPAVAVDDAIFDSDPWLLNVANGTLNLRSGRLKEPEREDYITRQISIAYEDSDGPTFQRFIRRILPDAQTRGFVQRLFGYSITGNVSEQIFPIFYGSGGNGKSTLNNCVLDIMGDYAKQAPTGLFMERRGGDEHPTALSDLQGTRIMFAFETDEGKKLAEGLVKQATGGDRIRARRMRQDYFEFTPTHHIFLITNHLPRIEGTDEGVWRRIRRVPFNVKITEEEKDGDLPAKLKEEYPYILKWLVAGCQGWLRHGLGAPEEVAEATSEWRGESDIVGRFIADMCTVKAEGTAQASTIYDQFKAWLDREGERQPVTQTSFGRRLTELGFKQKRDARARRVWSGISLRSLLAERQRW